MIVRHAVSDIKSDSKLIQSFYEIWVIGPQFFCDVQMYTCCICIPRIIVVGLLVSVNSLQMWTWTLRLLLMTSCVDTLTISSSGIASRVYIQFAFSRDIILHVIFLNTLIWIGCILCVIFYSLSVAFVCFIVTFGLDVGWYESSKTSSVMCLLQVAEKSYQDFVVNNSRLLFYCYSDRHQPRGMILRYDKAGTYLVLESETLNCQLPRR